jgi:hypothetical protein
LGISSVRHDGMVQHACMYARVRWTKTRKKRV